MVITHKRPTRPSPFTRLSLAALALASLSACSTPEIADRGIDDPHEAANRRVHDFNTAVDRSVVRPVLGTGAGTSQVLGPVRTGVRNVGETLDTPRRILDNLLQGRIGDAGHNAFRMTANLTFGLGGLFDVATEMGIEERDTDFGETLFVWGMEEGPYLEVPILGPSTTRDTIGDLMDATLNPVGRLLSGEALAWSRVIRVGGEVADYSRAAATIGDVLDNSADSYLIARQAWLQNRRFELERNAARARGEADRGFTRATAPGDTVDPYAEGAAAAEGVVDPYADFGAPAGGVDPYADLGAPAGGVDPYAGAAPPAGGVDPYADLAPAAGGADPYDSGAETPYTAAEPPPADAVVDPYEDPYAD